MAGEKEIQQSIALIESIPETFMSVIRAQQPTLFAEINIWTNSLETKGEKLVLSNANIAKIQQLNDRLNNILFAEKAEYLTGLQTYLRTLQQSGELNKSIFGSRFNNFVDKDIYANSIRASQLNISKIFDANAISTNIFQPMNQITQTAMASQSLSESMLRNIKDFYLGIDDKSGAFDRYGKTHASTAYSKAVREHQLAIANDVGVDNWEYVGGLIKDSRDFCVQRNGGVFSTEEVRSWGSLTWQGMIAGTNESNIFVNLGGWNCMHSLYPVSNNDKRVKS